jgi:hypothetical protein
VAVLTADPMPCLCDVCDPPTVIGTAALTTAASLGAGADELADMIDQMDIDPIARLYDTSIAYQLAFRRAEGLALQDQAVAASQVFRIRREGRRRAGIRLLALMAPGDLMVNTPLDFITNHLDVRLDLLFLLPDQSLPATVPDHDIMFCAAGEADGIMRARMHRLFTSWPRPALNDPNVLPALARDKLALSLADVPGICSPSNVSVSRTELESLLHGGGSIDTLLPNCSYPVLIRPHGSHAGAGLKKIDDANDLASYLLFSFASSYFVTAFVDYRSADGLYRKYRIAFIDREPHLCHMAVSQNWMIHYLNAGMTESADKRVDEAQAMMHFDAAFAVRHRDAFTALHGRLGFDCYSIDCSELSDGRLLVFEADSAAIIHLMDPEAMFPYKHVQMRRVFDAFGDLLRRRMAVAKSAPPRVRVMAQ